MTTGGGLQDGKDKNVTKKGFSFEKGWARRGKRGGENPLLYKENFREGCADGSM